MNYSIGYLLDLRKGCRKKLRKAVEYMDMSGVFYYTKMIDILNVLIRKKGYK